MNKRRRISAIVTSLTLAAGILPLGCEDNPISPSLPLGPEWLVYTRESSPLISDSVFAILAPGSEVWLGTASGVNRLIGESWAHIQDPGLDPVMTYQTVTTINEDRTGGLWFGLAGGQGIIYYNTNATDRQWQVIGTPTLPSGFVHAIATDILGEVWVGTGVGVSRFRYTGTNQLTDGRWTHYNSSNSPVPDEAIRSVGYNGADNHLWIGTSGAGIVSFDLDLDWNISSPADHPLPIVGMCFNADRSIWFATTGDWAYHFVIDTDVWTQVGRSDTGALFPSHLVRAVAGTAQTAWFATENGLVRLRNGLTTVYDTLSSPLPSNDVRSLAMDWKGNLWIGTTGGLAKHREGGTRP